jgi:hypothetical protein
MEILGILILAGFPIAGYNLLIKDDHLALLATDDNDIKGKLRSKIFKTSFFVCIGSVFAFHLVLAGLGEAVLMWAFISVPIVSVLNVLILLLIMEIVNRIKL